MTTECRRMSGLILITVPSIVYGGYFLLTILSGEQEALQLTEFQTSMFRAGHAHAGVLVILSLLAQLFTDHAGLSETWKWVVRVSFPLAAILVSLGFFAAAIGSRVTQPTSLIAILYAGIAMLVFALATLGIGLMRGKGMNS